MAGRLIFWRSQMCVTNAYIEEGDKQVLYLEAVDIIGYAGEKLYLRSMFGEEKYFDGEITEINLLTHRIVLHNRPVISENIG
jgi:predicted RNA-binding protein